MAIVLDHTLGGAAIDTSATTIPFTTTNAVASGGFIVVGVSVAGTLSSVSGGGLTWAIDKSGAVGGFNIYFASAQAPAGLATSTTITGNLSASVPGRSIIGVSFTGVAAASPLGTTSGPTAYTTTTAWTTASTSISAGSVLCGFSINDNSGTTSTITSPSVEDGDFSAGAVNFSVTQGHRIESSAGSYTVAGTWSAADSGAVIGAEYKAAAVGGVDPKTFTPAPFMPQGRNL